MVSLDLPAGEQETKLRITVLRIDNKPIMM